MAKHETPGRSNEWYTPEFVFEGLGAVFDIDVASPGAAVVPWVPALHHITEGSLDKPWFGFSWMNAPFGGRNGLEPWLRRFTNHGDGIALTPDRTSAPWWQTYAREMDAVLFWAPKIRFAPGPDAKESSPAQGTTLFALGRAGVAALQRAEKAGYGVLLRS